MRKLKNGIKVKICSSQRQWNKYNNGKPPYYAKDPAIVDNEVVKVYRNKETCIVTNVHLSREGWECDLLTSTGKKLSGFFPWELRKTLF